MYGETFNQAPEDKIIARVAVNPNCDFTIEHADEELPFRVYDNSLWVDGHESDDYHLRNLPEVEELEHDDDEVLVAITQADIDNAIWYIQQ